jgi:transketolase N-terminal domain/subunit
MSATVRVSDPGIEWTVHDPRELALRIRLRTVHMVARQGLGYLGQVWEAAMFAGHHRLDKVTVLLVSDLDGGFGIQMFGHIAKKKAVHGEGHIRATVDYVREGRKNNFD